MVVIHAHITPDFQLAFLADSAQVLCLFSWLYFLVECLFPQWVYKQKMHLNTIHYPNYSSKGAKLEDGSGCRDKLWWSSFDRLDGMPGMVLNNIREKTYQMPNNRFY